LSSQGKVILVVFDPLRDSSYTVDYVQEVAVSAMSLTICVTSVASQRFV